MHATAALTTGIHVCPWCRAQHLIFAHLSHHLASAVFQPWRAPACMLLCPWGLGPVPSHVVSPSRGEGRLRPPPGYAQRRGRGSSPHAGIVRAQLRGAPEVVQRVVGHVQQLVGLAQAVPGPVVLGVQVRRSPVRIWTDNIVQVKNGLLESAAL